jgi:DNA-binding GntR family transcriptional regulator
MKTASCAEVLARLRAEYLEMPGMRLTAAQVQRLCGVERTTCQWALDRLVAAKFLCVKDGGYARLTDEAASRPRAAKADLGVHPRVATAS